MTTEEFDELDKWELLAFLLKQIKEYMSELGSEVSSLQEEIKHRSNVSAASESD